MSVLLTPRGICRQTAVIPRQNSSLTESRAPSFLISIRWPMRTTTAPTCCPVQRYFTDCVQALGIGKNSRVVVYDGKGLFSAARVWWMFRVFGHERVQILEGGCRAGLPPDMSTEQGEHRRRSHWAKGLLRSVSLLGWQTLTVLRQRCHPGAASSSTRARLLGLPARRLSRGRACAPVTFPVQKICTTPRY